MTLLPVSYFGPIEEYGILAKANLVEYETCENFVKQSYRNRCLVMGANGMLRLTVPLVLKSREKTPVKDIRISNSEKWQSHHWKSIYSGYKNSPFFDYYESELLPLFLNEYKYLLDLNFKTNEVIQSCLGLNTSVQASKSFKPYHQDGDLRLTIHPKKTPITETPRYIQVFEEKHGFVPNLSILDLLFNEGPQALIYLQNL